MIDHDTTTPDVETASEDYARRFAGPSGRYLLGVQETLAGGLLAPHRERIRTVLDVGGGHAQLTEMLLGLGARVWVQGSSPACAARLAPAMARHGERLRFVTSGLWDLPFPDRSFDLVVGVRLLAHVVRWQALLAEMARVSRRLVLVDYAPWSSANILEPLLFRLKRRAEGNTRPFFCYWPSEIRQALGEEGFPAQSLAKEFAAPMVVHRALGRPGVSRGLEAACRGLGLTYLLGSPVLLLAERPAGERDAP